MEGNEYLFEANKDLIPKVAKKFYSYGKSGVEYEDLYQEASLALHLATVKFNPKKWEEKPFEKFAVTYMYQKIMTFLSRQNVLYTPQDVVTLAAKLKREKLTEIPVAALAKQLNVTEEAISKALQHLKGVHLVGIDTEVSEGGNVLKYADVLPDTTIACMTDKMYLDMFRATLNAKESVVFKLLLEEETKQSTGLTRRQIEYAKGLISTKYKKFMKV